MGSDSATSSGRFDRRRSDENSPTASINLSITKRSLANCGLRLASVLMASSAMWIEIARIRSTSLINASCASDGVPRSVLSRYFGFASSSSAALNRAFNIFTILSVTGHIKATPSRLKMVWNRARNVAGPPAIPVFS